MLKGSKSLRTFVLAFAVLSTAVFAQKQEHVALMTPAQLLATAQSVPNEKTRTQLIAWVQACTTQRWGKCHVQWWNMTQTGGLTQIEQDGYSGWWFIGQPIANRVLTHMTAALNHPLYRAHWDLDVKTYGEAEGLPNIIDGRAALTNGADHVLVLRMLDHNLRHFNISYNMHQEMATPSAEWLRLLAMMLATRGDTHGSYEVLNYLHAHVKNNARDAVIYNATVRAAKALIEKTKGVRR